MSVLSYLKLMISARTQPKWRNSIFDHVFTKNGYERSKLQNSPLLIRTIVKNAIQFILVKPKNDINTHHKTSTRKL